jgi:nitrite reductase/ring-hydroxylating ferredoxin subunit
MDYPDSEPRTIPPDGGPEAEQPRWRQDFPIDSLQEEYIARRDFTKFMVLTSIAFAAGQFWILAQNFYRKRKPRPPVKEIIHLADIPVGGWLVFDYPRAHERALLVRLDETRLVAYDQKCTHLSCPVMPRVEEGRLHCPCHEGTFDLASGRPLAGPPRRPLTPIKLEIHDGRIYAAGMEERTA